LAVPYIDKKIAKEEIGSLVSKILWLILILSPFCLPLTRLQVSASGSIVINVDGSINPPTVPILTADKITYIFTADINGSVEVLRSNIIIDGNGYTLQPFTSPSYSGFLLNHVNNVTIKNMNIQKFGTSGVNLYRASDSTVSGNDINASSDIILDESSNNTISDNNITVSRHYGVALYQSEDNKIHGNSITATRITENRPTIMRTGIFLWSSSGNSLNMNNVTHSEKGIHLWVSSNNVLRSNMMAGNDYNFLVEDAFVNDVDISNTIDGKPIYYLINKQNATVPSNAGFVALVNCTKIIAQALNLTNNMQGILLALTTNSTLTMNNIMNNDYGVRLYKSSNNTISQNNIAKNGANVILVNSSGNRIFQNSLSDGDVNHGSIDCWYSDNNTISENTIKNNFRGINLEESSNNIIFENNVINNTGGIVISNSQNNSLFENSVTRNRVTGIQLGNSSNNMLHKNIVTTNNVSGILLCEWSEHNTIFRNNIKNNSIGILIGISSNNKIWHNNFIENPKHAEHYFYGATNLWDDGLEGNYWSNHGKVDFNHDGIGDSPYIIDQKNKDNYPLMGKVHSFNTSSGDVYAICNSTISDFQCYYDSENQTNVIKFDVNGTEGSGFCRICIPHTILNETYTVLVDGHEPDYVNYTLYDNGTHHWIYFNYQHSVHEIVIVPEFPSFLILPLFMIATLLAVIVYKRKHQTRNKKREL